MGVYYLYLRYKGGHPMLPTLWVHSHPITKYNDQFYYKKVHDIYPSVPGHPMPDIWYYPMSYVIILCTVILSLFMLVFPLPWHHTLMECYQLVWYRFSYKDFFTYWGNISYPFLGVEYLPLSGNILLVCIYFPVSPKVSWCAHHSICFKFLL